MTTFGDKLRSIRDQAIADGMPLLTEDEVLEERKRRLVGEEEPLPCPWCGYPPRILRRSLLAESLPGWYKLECWGANCMVHPETMNWYATPAEATAVWNRRK